MVTAAADEGLDVLVDRPAPGIARITLNRPQRRNALTPQMRERLREAVLSRLADAEVKALVLTGAGGHFCAGGDVARLVALPKNEVAALLRSAHGLIRALIESPKPVIAAVSGAAAGGGAGLALACDHVLMADDARIVLPFHRLALVPDYGLAYTLARRVGAARAHQMMLNPEPVTAPAALAAGIADAKVPAIDLAQAAVDWAVRVARQSPLALAGMKRLMLAQSLPVQETLDIEVEAQVACFASPQFQVGAQAFLAKKAPGAP